MNKFLPLTAMFLWFISSIQSQTAFLDPSFGNGGIALPAGLEYGGFPNMVVQADGKILVRDVHTLNTGNSEQGVWIHRFLSDGSFDQSFGTGGSILAGVISHSNTRGNDLELLPDGKILTGYYSITGANDTIKTTIVRLMPDGSKDASFGTNGQVNIIESVPAVGDFPFLHDVEVQSTGRIVLVYHSHYSLYANYGFRLLQPNGYILSGYEDVNWGYIGDMDEFFTQALIQPDDKILIGGFRDPISGPSTEEDFLLERFESHTFTDDNFGFGGYAIADNNNQVDRMYDLFLEPDGKILTSGVSWPSTVMILKFLSTGAPDPSFGTNGKVLHTNLIAGEFTSAMSRSPDGRFVVSGWKSPLTFNHEAAIARYLPNGDIDTTFSPDGVVYLPFAETNLYTDFHDVIVLPDRRILACGVANTPSKHLFMVRFLPETDAVAWYRDLDGDGYGTSADIQYSVAAPTGYAPISGDCNDDNLNINPGAIEICGNEIDDNCDGIEAIDSLPPMAVCKDQIKIYLDSLGTVQINAIDLDNGSFDDCASTLSFGADTSTFDCMDWGINIVTLTVTDEEGNSSICQTIVKVADQIIPTAICLPTLDLFLDDWGNASLTALDINDGSFDNCGAIMNYWIDATAFNCTDLGIHSVTLTVEDNFSNINTCQTTVTIQDKQSPVVVCADTITLQVDAIGLINIPLMAIESGSFDNCAGMLEFQINPSQLSIANLGFNTITLTATDISGNENTCITIVELVDKTLGSHSLQNAQPIIVSPNPSTGIFELQVPEDMVSARAEVTNASGQLIWLETVRSRRFNIDLSNQISGCYYLKMQSATAVRMIKLLLLY